MCFIIIIGNLVFFNQIAFVSFLVFNPAIVNEKATDKWCALYNCDIWSFRFKFNVGWATASMHNCDNSFLLITWYILLS